MEINVMVWLCQQQQQQQIIQAATPRKGRECTSSGK